MKTTIIINNIKTIIIIISFFLGLEIMNMRMQLSVDRDESHSVKKKNLRSKIIMILLYLSLWSFSVFWIFIMICNICIFTIIVFLHDDFLYFWCVVYYGMLWSSPITLNGVTDPSSPDVHRLRGDHYIPFPLGQPTLHNIYNICHYSGQRPRFPTTGFPGSGFGRELRQSHANCKLESWFLVCCGNGTRVEDEDEETLTLCCAEQAVRKYIIYFIII